MPAADDREATLVRQRRAPQPERDRGARQRQEAVHLRDAPRRVANRWRAGQDAASEVAKHRGFEVGDAREDVAELDVQLLCRLRGVRRGGVQRRQMELKGVEVGD
eukprot:31544-Pelagococcus_subviridis.AAC.5